MAEFFSQNILRTKKLPKKCKKGLGKYIQYLHIFASRKRILYYNISQYIGIIIRADNLQILTAQCSDLSFGIVISNVIFIIKFSDTITLYLFLTFKS